MEPTGTVTYRASHQRNDGGWRHLEVTLPTDATDGDIEQALALWHRIDGKALDALKEAAAQEQPQAASPDVVIDFGKHRGQTIRQVLAHERDYVEWMAQNARADLMRRSARMALGEADAEAEAQDDPERNGVEGHSFVVQEVRHDANTSSGLGGSLLPRRPRLCPPLRGLF
jgi:protein-tyrosine-phosphatase